MKIIDKILGVVIVVLSSLVASCSGDDVTPPDTTASITTAAYSVTQVDAKANLSSAATYKWSVEGKTSASSDLSGTIYSLTNTTSKMATFIAAEGSYQLKLVATDSAKLHEYSVRVVVKKPTVARSPYIAKVYDLLPAPGQFVNELPEYDMGDTKADIVEKVDKALSGKKNGGLVSLGGFGGYITFGFDHTIVNVEGKRDVRIMGNAFYAVLNPDPNAPQKGSCEAGIVMVAYDANNNGVADDNEWYEIAGSEYNKPTTIKNYEITYFRPTLEDSLTTEYIRWEDNQGGSGYKAKNAFHDQSYYPLWISEDEITFKGTLLPNNAVDESAPDAEVSYWVLYAYGYGYADNAPNESDDSAIDIGWAVDADGDKVELPGIDFMKIYTGINQEAGWLGEISTDFSGAYDIHMFGESVDSAQ